MTTAALSQLENGAGGREGEEEEEDGPRCLPSTHSRIQSCAASIWLLGAGQSLHSPCPAQSRMLEPSAGGEDGRARLRGVGFEAAGELARLIGIVASVRLSASVEV